METTATAATTDYTICTSNIFNLQSTRLYIQNFHDTRTLCLLFEKNL